VADWSCQCQLPISKDHFDRQVVLLDFIEKTLERFNAATVQGLVVFHQQQHRAFAEHAARACRSQLSVKIAPATLSSHFAPKAWARCRAVISSGLGLDCRPAKAPW